LLAKLKRNDEVVTTGGLLGRINEVGDKVIVLEVAPNVRVRVERSQITALSSYGKPAAGKKE
jgi:preprotein translocase subunit YajC